MSRTGYSPIYRAPAGAMTWRGLSLGQIALQNCPPTGNPIAWDIINAETDGIASTGTTTEGAYSIPAGAAGIVPTGMAGLWRLCGNCDVYPDSSAAYFAFSIVINNFAQFWENDLAEGTYPDDFNLGIAPFVVPLEEGDVIWALFTNAGGGSGTDAGGGDATFLMEYVGPLPDEMS